MRADFPCLPKSFINKVKLYLLGYNSSAITTSYSKCPVRTGGGFLLTMMGGSFHSIMFVKFFKNLKNNLNFTMPLFTWSHECIFLKEVISKSDTVEGFTSEIILSLQSANNLLFDNSNFL